MDHITKSYGRLELIIVPGKVEGSFLELFPKLCQDCPTIKNIGSFNIGCESSKYAQIMLKNIYKSSYLCWYRTFYQNSAFLGISIYFYQDRIVISILRFLKIFFTALGSVFLDC